MNAEKTYSVEELTALGVIGQGQKHDPASVVSNWVGPHGTGGLFSSPGIRPDMYATVPQIIGLTDMIPTIGHPMVNERYSILTGMTGGEGTRATDICSEGPTPGKLKECSQNIPFGTFKMDTEVDRITRFGSRIDYADLDRNVLNIQANADPMMPSILNGNNINTRTGKKFYELGYAIKRSYSVMDIQGTVGATSNASDYAPWIAQYNGLSQLIATGYTDALTSVACPAADSHVVNFNAAITGNGVNGYSFEQTVVDVVRSVIQRGEDIGMPDFEFAIVLHPNARFAIFDQWSCNYWTDRCSGTGAGDPVTRDAMTIRTFRDQMFNANYLLVDGMRIPIVYSHGMQWHGVANNTFITDMFIVPLRWRGRPLLFRQYFPLNNSDAVSYFNNVVEGGPRIINNGMYAVGKRTTNEFCTKYEFIGQSRLILDTPFLAARVNDLQVAYTVSGFDPYVGMSNYRDGGQSTRY